MSKIVLKTQNFAGFAIGFALGIGLVSAGALTALPTNETAEAHIIQGAGLPSAKVAMAVKSREITYESGVIRTVRWC